MGATNFGSLRLFLSVVPAFFILFVSSLLQAYASPLLGVSPQDEEYFDRSVIPCKDGSKSFPRSRLNDGFCDCPDGTDEPGTSACPESKFYCRNVGDIPRFLFSSRVNDRICDCCDGSDEYDGGVLCPHRCIQDGEDAIIRSDDPGLAKIKLNYTNAQGRKSRLDFEDLIQNLNGLEGLIMIQLISAICVMTFCLFCRHTRARRRYSSLPS